MVGPHNSHPSPHWNAVILIVGYTNQVRDELSPNDFVLKGMLSLLKEFVTWEIKVVIRLVVCESL